MPVHMDSMTYTTTDTVIYDPVTAKSAFYYYSVAAMDRNRNYSELSESVSYAPLGVEDILNGVPEKFALSQNYPNPFNPSTTLRFDLPAATEVTLMIYDLLGREVTRLAEGRMEPGYYRVAWDARDATGREVPTGMYIARLATPEYTKSIKMVLLK